MPTEEPKGTAPFDAWLDAAIAEDEHPTDEWPTDPLLMQRHHELLVEAGLLDPDEPTPWTHYVEQNGGGLR